MNEKKRYSLPEKDRERLKRSEMNTIIYFRCVLASAGYCWKDLNDRLECIPSGRQRFKMAMGAFNAVMDDVLGTVPGESQKRLGSITNDYKIILAPKAQTEPKAMILQREDAETVMRAALNTCADCYMSDEEARRNCKLYRVMETYCPLDDYGNGLICQYGKSEIR